MRTRRRCAGATTAPAPLRRPAPPPWRAPSLPLRSRSPRAWPCQGAAEHEHVARRRRFRRRDCTQVTRGRFQHASRARSPPPSRACRAARFPARARQAAPNPAHQPEAVAADAALARLMLVGRADPVARCRTTSSALWRVSVICQLQAPPPSARAAATAREASSRNRCPACAESRESSTCWRTCRQVAKCLSQPAVTTKVSPAARGARIACPQLEPRCRLPSPCDFTSLPCPRWRRR